MTASPRFLASGGLGDQARIAVVRRILTAGIPPEGLDRRTGLAGQLLEELGRVGGADDDVALVVLAHT